MKRNLLEQNIIEPSAVYCYEFPHYNAVYVGRCLQRRINTRHSEHKRGLFMGIKRTGDSVFDFAKENRIDVPRLKILEKGLELEDSCEKEQYYIDRYKKNGWIIINKAKSGRGIGSVGCLGHGIWNFNTSYEEALKYKSKNEFMTKNPTVYFLALRNKWMKSYFWLTDKNEERKWTYNKCKEEALKYKTKKEFSTNNNKAYSAAVRHGWISTFDWFENGRRYARLEYTYEKCETIAKTCKNKNEFQRKNKSAYTRAWKEGWLKDWFGKERAKYGFYDLYENVYNVAKQYEYLSDFRKERATVYDKACKNKWLETFTWLQRKRINKKDRI